MLLQTEIFLGLPFNVWWFLVFGAVISGYAILDGFDLGAGALHLFLKKEQSRRIAINAIGPMLMATKYGWSLAGALCSQGSRWRMQLSSRILYSFYGVPDGHYFSCHLH